MTIDEIRKIKAELGYSNKVLAERAGIPLGTLQKVLSGATKHPRRETILALSQGAFRCNKTSQTGDDPGAFPRT